MEQREVYLDNSATTQVCEEAAQAVLRAMRREYGNAASLHKKGWEAQKLLIEAKKGLARLLACEEGEIYFTSGATESNNISILGGTAAAKRRGDRIVTTAVEHASVLACAGELERQGYEVVKILPREDGNFDPMDFYEAVDDRTVLVSAMYVNNETGLLLPVEEIGKAVKRKNPNVLFHVDAVQGFLKQPLRLKRSPIDLLSASGHKIYAPKGVGLLYLRKGVRVKPLFFGGGQQDGIRVGTEAVPLAAGFYAAAKQVAEHQKQDLAHYEKLKEHLLSRMAQIEDVSINEKGNCVPYIVNLSVKKVRSEVMLHFLEQYGIYVSSGSACSKGAKSHVLSAFGYADDRIDTALRLSFSPQTTKEDLDYFADKLKEGAQTLMKLK
ncbi:cysteine desulfurase family protein [Massiliimalia timonensis]|uniref:cysteine desulfurase family protein n=1 Tax=Massiliimalia timonensis TaxID=1987501 RepID=UPI00189CF529|nr:cysteine desulfurase family protein [Massiliimalia timonensis]